MYELIHPAQWSRRNLYDRDFFTIPNEVKREAKLRGMKYYTT
jgi:hypothetical protein